MNHEEKKLNEIQIQECLASEYQIVAEKLNELHLGADVHATIYKAESIDGQKYFVKSKKNQSENIGSFVLELLKMSGIQNVNLPIHSQSGKLVQACNDFDLIVFPFVE